MHKVIIMNKKRIFCSGEIYHICNKSIANFRIFNGPILAGRFINLLEYYNTTLTLDRFSVFLRKNKNYKYKNLLSPKEFPLVKFISYCIMPDHYHILVKILSDNLISKFINDIQNSYSRYLNTRFKRKGPLWQSRFRSIKIISNEQLLHVSRYIHLNPTTSRLVKIPEEWDFSSYKDFISDEQTLEEITEISIQSRVQYRKFVEDRKDYQKKLREIRKFLMN